MDPMGTNRFADTFGYVWRHLQVNVDICLVYPWYIQLNSTTSPAFEGNSFQNCKVFGNHSEIQKKHFPVPRYIISMCHFAPFFAIVLIFVRVRIFFPESF